MKKLWQRLPIEWRFMLEEFRVALIALLMFICGTTAYFIFVVPDRHVHAGYLQVQTLSRFDATTDSGISIHAVVRLPDGTQTTVSTSSLAAAQWLVSDTCVEKRQRDSGKVFYKLAAPSNCLP